ncbi:hypothetical protein [Leadbettera azotonutricia]|uniref:Uncharacterized protein n=1 Tax=Leadbettera azotonutricia (strain ATCC BAA-888 / DSM 13862 / ZAS-9) TaxID=545695 RepID=F5Y9T2_LEAAZ|nr:hypothetical protein [Leadbettera azotonutricia]AEF82174.1 hypothetical protein TREAZ_3188 [Leadbettera azotonutricia ZAS-9]
MELVIEKQLDLATVCDELNKFLKANRIVNVEKRMIDGECGTRGQPGTYCNCTVGYIPIFTV